MRGLLFFAIIFLCAVSGWLHAQEVPPPVVEQQLENEAGLDEGEIEDDSYLQQLEFFRRHPLPLNDAGAEELQLLRILSPLQIDHFLRYRHITGFLIDVHELQAVPIWDLLTIKKILPYIVVRPPQSAGRNLLSRVKSGDHQLVLRYGQILEKAKGYYPKDSVSAPAYRGGPQRYFFRYRYQYKNLLQWGVTGDKDAGESFIKKPVKGFDFYSAHLFIRQLGLIKTLALGDFTVNMGQGLIQWQSLAFGKSADISGIKRQSSVLRPYSSAGEYNFHRGIGVTVGKKIVELTIFVSHRRHTANQSADSAGMPMVTSINTSGYHRTEGEMADRKILRQLAAGGNIRIKKGKWNMGLNAVAYWFDKPIQKQEVPYNLYAINGQTWQNYSIDYGYTLRNIHLFGEAAITGRGDKALVTGMVAGLGRQADLTLFYRNISEGYQALYAKAMTENANPSNEEGLYAGLQLRPSPLIRLQLYADIFRFPWLKYRVHGPSSGADYLGQVTYTPGKTSELSLRYRQERKSQNMDAGYAMPVLSALIRRNFRTNFQTRLSADIGFRARAEWVQVQSEKAKEEGFLMYGDIQYQPVAKKYALSLRLQYFETDSYQSRVYAYENDVLYSYSIPMAYGKGARYYLLLKYKLNKKVQTWLRWAQTLYQGQETIGSGNDEIMGRQKTEIKFQISINFF